MSCCIGRGGQSITSTTQLRHSFQAPLPPVGGARNIFRTSERPHMTSVTRLACISVVGFKTDQRPKSDLKDNFAQEGWSLEELHRTLGARITGVAADPSSFSPEQRTLLAAAFATYDLLLFPDQVLTPAQEFAFITSFPHDENAVARAQKSLKGQDPYSPVLRIPDCPLITVWPHGIPLTDYWGLSTPEAVWEDHHAAWRQACIMDPSTHEVLRKIIDRCGEQDWGDRPSSNSLSALYHVESNESNQVSFCSASAAWERLTPEEQSSAAKLRAVYRRDAFAGCGVFDTCEDNILRMPHEECERVCAAADARGTAGTVMPLFNEDPLTGSRSLNCHPLHFYTFEGMQRPEAGELLKSYIVPVTAPDQVLNLTWEKGDLAVWNNRKVLHTGTPSREADKTSTRLFHMTLLDCDAPLEPITV